MTRKCRIHALSPITCFSVPIIGDTELNLTTEEIYSCLCAKAEVSEILPNGKVVELDFTNYNKPAVEKVIKKHKPTPVAVEVKPDGKTLDNTTVEEKVEPAPTPVEEAVEEPVVEEQPQEVKEEETTEEAVEEPVQDEVQPRNKNYRNNTKKKNRK